MRSISYRRLGVCREARCIISLRYEQYWAMARSRGFLVSLLNPKIKWKVSELRREAAACLKHYPPLGPEGEPMFSRDDSTKDRHR